MTAHLHETNLHLVTENETADALLEQVEVISRREGGLIEAKVPVDLIDSEEVPVNEVHVAELRESFENEAASGNGSGQLSPILLAQVPGMRVLKIIDGFHRDAVINQLGLNEEYATIRPNTSMEELLDLRVITANMHKSVNFARISTWMTEAWAATEWADKISASQAFGLGSNETSGSKLGLTTDEAQAVIAWAQQKSERWQMSPGAIRLNLYTAEVSAPDLVASVRQPSGGKSKTLTPLQLQVLAETMPDDHSRQRLAAAIIGFNGLTVGQARMVAQTLAEVGSMVAAVELANNTDWSSFKAKRAPAKSRAPRSATPTPRVTASGDELSLHAKQEYLYTHIELAVASVQNLVYRGDYVVSDEQERIRRAALAVNFTGDDRAITLLSRSGNGVEIEGAFEQHMHTVKPKTLDYIVKVGRRSDVEASVIVHAVTDRIRHDIHHGALSFVGELNPFVHGRLIKRAIDAELAKRRSVGDFDQGLPGRIAETVNIDLEQMLERITNMSLPQRKVMVYGSMMGLSQYAIEQLLGVDSAKAQTMLRINRDIFKNN